MSLTTNIRIHASELVVKPNFQILRRYRRSLLNRQPSPEQALRSRPPEHQGCRTTEPDKLIMRIFNQRRVAFIFFPHLAETTPLDTMPFARHIIGRLASSGCHIDVFHWSKLNSPNRGLFPENVHYKHVRMYTTKNKMKLIELTLRLARYMRYRCVFSVGLIGSYIGGVMSATSRCPFVLLNDEFPSMYGQTRWLPLERWAARRANVIVVPSDGRHTTLREELRLDADKPFVTIRNTPELPCLWSTSTGTAV